MATIVVADDEHDVIELLRFILEKEGHKVMRKGKRHFVMNYEKSLMKL